MPNWEWEAVWDAVVPSVIILICFAFFVPINPLLGWGCLEHVGRGGVHWVTERGLCSPSHSSSQHGLPSPSHLPPFWGQRVIYLKSFGLSMDLTIWEASLYHCTISFLSVWPPHLAKWGLRTGIQFLKQPFWYSCGTWEWFQYSTINIF